MSQQDFLGALVTTSETDETSAKIVEMLLAIEDFEQVCMYTL